MHRLRRQQMATPGLDLDDIVAMPQRRLHSIGPLSDKLQARLARGIGEAPPPSVPWTSVIGRIQEFDDGFLLALQYHGHRRCRATTTGGPAVTLEPS